MAETFVITASPPPSADENRPIIVIDSDYWLEWNKPQTDFALLGAADNTCGLEPDYIKDATRIFLKATIAFLEHGYVWPLNFRIYGHDFV